MASGGVKKASGGFLSKLRSAFRERFVVGHDYEPYMPPSPTTSTALPESQTSSTPQRKDGEPVAYRYPSPASQPSAEVPFTYPETVYDTNLYKRPLIQVKASSEALQELHDSHVAAPTDIEYKDIIPNPPPFPIEHAPRHTPHPWWTYDDEAIAAMRKMYIESGGLLPIGWWRNMRNKNTMLVGTKRDL